MTPLKIQKDIVSCVLTETTNVIIREMDGALFSIIIDESRDILQKSKWLLYYVMWIRMDMWLNVFVGIEHVSNTTVVSLKESLDNIFSRLGLSLSMLCG